MGACLVPRAWHDSYVLAVFLIAGLVILIGVVLVAAGRGGELSQERNDYAPLDLGPVTATDVALLRPPANAWGYNMEATDEALTRIAESIRERDVRIVALEQLVTDLSREPAPPSLSSPYIGARRRPELEPPQATQPAEAMQPLEAALPVEAAQPLEAAEPLEAAGPVEAAEPNGPAWQVPPSWPEASQPEEAAEADEAAQPGEAAELDKTVWQSAPPWPEASRPSGESRSDEAPGQPDQPGQPGQPDQPGQPGPPERSHG